MKKYILALQSSLVLTRTESPGCCFLVPLRWRQSICSFCFQLCSFCFSVKFCLFVLRIQSRHELQPLLVVTTKTINLDQVVVSGLVLGMREEERWGGWNKKIGKREKDSTTRSIWTAGSDSFKSCFLHFQQSYCAMKITRGSSLEIRICTDHPHSYLFPGSHWLGAHLVVVGRILWSKLQLLDDDLVRPHLHVAHGFKESFEVDVIQSPRRSANQSWEHLHVRPEPRPLQKNTKRRWWRTVCMNTITVVCNGSSDSANSTQQCLLWLLGSVTLHLHVLQQLQSVFLSLAAQCEASKRLHIHAHVTLPHHTQHALEEKGRNQKPLISGIFRGLISISVYRYVCVC